MNRATWVIRILERVSARLPRRIADEEIGDAIEEITRRPAPSIWWLTARLLTTLFAVLVHGIRHVRIEGRPLLAEEACARLFERYVRETRPSWKRRALMSVSLGAHGAAAIALVLFSMAHVDEVTPPTLSVFFFSTPTNTPANTNPEPEPPPPPPAGAHHDAKRDRGARTALLAPATQPAVERDRIEPANENRANENRVDSGDSNHGPDDGSNGTGEDGQEGGKEGGLTLLHRVRWC